MDASWNVWLRDIMIILATAALLITSVMGALVMWQVYKLARELRAELQPILESLRETADTVRGTAEFVGGKVVGPSVSAVGAVAGARGVYALLQAFYRGFGRSRKPD